VAHVDLGGLWHEASFRLVETYDVEVERGWRIALDPQPYGEVVRVLTGRCRFSLGDEHQDVGPGGVGILLPGPARVTADLGEGPLRFRGFGFRVELFGSIELSGLLGLPLAIPHPWPALDDGLAEVIRYGDAADPADAFRARATAELVTASLVERVGEVRSPGRAVRTEVSVVLALMDEDPGRDLDLATLAAAANLSPKHFARLFKNVAGVPPMAYLQALRVSRAREELAASDRSVASVASSLGFADAAHLSRAFRKAYGTTPTAFRSRARALETSPFGTSRRSSSSISRPLAG
jgi:AraC-like DNA-binding protein